MDYRLVNIKDCELLYKWANDEDVRFFSFTQDKIEFDSHKIWLEQKLKQKGCYIYIVSDNGNDVGQMRIEVDKQEAVISYSVDKDFRGHGYGTKMLLDVIELVKQYEEQVKRVIGKVKFDNIISQKAFLKAGFQRDDKDTHIEYFYLIYE